MVCTFKISLTCGRNQHTNNDNTKGEALHMSVYGLLRKPLRKKLGRRQEKGAQQKR